MHTFIELMHNSVKCNVGGRAKAKDPTQYRIVAGEHDLRLTEGEFTHCFIVTNFLIIKMQRRLSSSGPKKVVFAFLILMRFSMFSVSLRSFLCSVSGC